MSIEYLKYFVQKNSQ